MVEKATGPQRNFLKIAETILANSGADRTTSFAYAVAWTQHTYGVQIIGACALLQLLLGNIGPRRRRHGAPRPRVHSGSTDIPTLYHSIQGYLAAPTALKKHDTLQDYIAGETIPTGYWANMPKFMVSILSPFTVTPRPRRTSSATTGIRKFSATIRTWPCSWR